MINLIEKRRKEMRMGKAKIRREETRMNREEKRSDCNISNSV